MILQNKIILLILLVPVLSLAQKGSSHSGQKQKKADKLVLERLQTHIRYLSDDKMEGRRAGTAGEKLASDYISIEFSKAGLQSKGDNGGWLQRFPIDEGLQLGPASEFSVNGQDWVLGNEYFPLAYSGLQKVSGSPAIALQEAGSPWFIDLKDLLETGAGNPHFELETGLRDKIMDCVGKGATAVLLYNSSKIPDKLSFDGHDKSERMPVPVIYITREAKKKYLKDESATLEIKIRMEITGKSRTGHNVVGWMDNGAASTVIIGAHYDHLGHGEDHNTMGSPAENQIYNGADDNASGVAALIELANLLKLSRFHGNNYLFLAFSGEEQGLFGSRFFVEHPAIGLGTVNYMINLDMIGRLNDSSHALTIGGWGSSPTWRENGGTLPEKGYFSIKFDSSGTGPSDHTSFYRKDIPVLFFFTGIHPDYHRPTDDYDKINYQGELDLLKYIYSLIGNLDSKGRMAFSRTRESPMGAPRFAVTLGIMPDYSFSGSGVRADGVSEGRPAQKAGLKAGDVIVQLGDYPVSSLENYMEALGKFRKGDSAGLKYRRGNELMETKVQF